MPLLDISNELLLCISENLESERDINAFTRTNRRLYYLLNGYLYRHNIQKSGGSALSWVAEHGREATAQRLLEEGANIQVKTVNVSRALLTAAMMGHKAMVKLLLDAKADINTTDSYRRTALYSAAMNGHVAVVKLLLEAKANINVGAAGKGRHCILRPRMVT